MPSVRLSGPGLPRPMAVGAGGGLVEERGDGVSHVGDDGLWAGAHACGHDAAGEELHAGVECADAKAGAAEVDAEMDERALVVRRNGGTGAGSQRTSGDAARMRMKGGRLLQKRVSGPPVITVSWAKN